MPAHRNSSILSLLRTVNHRPTSTLRAGTRRNNNKDSDDTCRPVNRQSAFWSAHQRRWARVQDAHPRFLATHELKNELKRRKEEEIVDRYRRKLADKAREQGLESISELKDAYSEKIRRLRRTASITGIPEGSLQKGPSEDLPDVSAVSSSSLPSTSAPQSSFPDTHSAVVSGQPSQSSTSTPTSSSSLPYPAPPPPPTPQPATDPAALSLPPGIKPLSSYLDVNKIKTLSVEQIEALWRVRHSNNSQALIATVPAKTYNTMMRLAKQHPQFVLPVPREGTGAEIHFMQWATYGTLPPSSTDLLGEDAGAALTKDSTTSLPHTATILFTHLAEYKLRGEYATPHTTVTLHADLLPEKGLVLAVGQVQENRNVSMDDAKWLLMCLQRFYGLERAQVRGQLLKQFSDGDEGFSVQTLMDEAERMG